MEERQEEAAEEDEAEAHALETAEPAYGESLALGPLLEHAADHDVGREADEEHAVPRVAPDRADEDAWHPGLLRPHATWTRPRPPSCAHVRSGRRATSHVSRTSHDVLGAFPVPRRPL